MADQDELIQNSMLLLGIRMKTLTSTQLDIIIEHGGNINTKDANDRNNTPLHVAACKGVPEIVQLLLDRGAKVSEKNSTGQTPLDVAQGSEVVEILKKHIQNVPKQELRPASDHSVAEQSTTENKTIFYSKRSGTSGFCGQLYETKLLTLILFRALKRKDIAEFYLGSNVDGLGALDDVVFWFRDIYGKTRMQFIQAKHRDDPDKDGKLTLGETLKEKGDYSIHKYFDSFLAIRRKFGSKSEDDQIFREEFQKVDCDFVIYTSAKENFDCKKGIDTETTEFNTKTDDILYSTNRGKTFKFEYSPQNVKTLATVATKLRIQTLGNILADFVLSGRTDNVMSDDLMRTYHVVLAQKLFKHSETGQMTFKTDFFASKEKLVVILREIMYDKILEYRKQKFEDSDLQNFLKVLLENPSAENISKLLGNVLRYDNSLKTLTPIKNRVKLDALQEAAFKNIIVTQETIRNATDIVGRSTLESLKVKFPPSFGNLDLPIGKGNQEQRIKHLVQRFKVLFQLAAQNDNIVRIDESMIGKILNSGDVGLNGGFAGMVGNILIPDQNTNLLKFNVDGSSLQSNAKRLLELLKSEIGIALESYRLEIKVDCFPRLTLENKEEDEQFAKCFLDNLMFYTDQGKENEVEATLKNEIKSSYKISDDLDCEAVFLKVHDKVQHLWKQQKKAPYLTRDCDYFDAAVVQVRDNPPLTNLSAICISQINRYQVEFKSEAVQSLVSHIGEGVTNIVSNFVEQTCIKLLQHFDKDSRLFITFQYLKIVLPHLKEVFQFKTVSNICKTMILVGDLETVNDIEKMLNEFKNSKIKLIIVTNARLSTYVDHLIDEGSIFSDLVPDSQTKLLKEREIYFQCAKIKLGQLMGCASLDIIDVGMLSQLISKCDLMITGGVDLTQFENVAEFLIERKLLRKMVKIRKGVKNTDHDVWVKSCEDFKRKCIDNETINVHLVDSKMSWQKSRGSLSKVRENIESTHEQIVTDSLELYSERIVIVAAEPGMGKSTLITDLSKRITQHDPLCWVVRIDLLNYTKEFNKWLKLKIIDLPLAIKFILIVQQIISSDEETSFTLSADGTIHLKNTARSKISGKTLFEIELFLSFYNKGNITLLFDGFDEISPNYKEPILKLLKILQNNEKRLWITTRNDNNHYELEDNLSKFAYTIKPFSKQDQKKFLHKFWKVKLKLKHIDNHRFSIFASNLIKLFSNTINNTEASFMGIPLQMRMIATIFLNDFKKFLFKEHAFTNRIERQISAKLDLVVLYEEFFRIKLEEVLFGDKSPNIDKSDPKICELMQEKRQSIAEKHEKLALCALLEDQELNALQVLPGETSKFLEDFISGREKVGFISQVVKDKPRFVHQTFAEYFAARYLWSKFKSSKRNSDRFIREVFVQILTKSNRYQVCCFVQQIALQDFKVSLNSKELGSKIGCLLVNLVPLAKNYSYIVESDFLHRDYSHRLKDGANECAKTLLKIVENFIISHNECVINSMKSLNIMDCFCLFSIASSEGYYNLIQKFVGIFNPSILQSNLAHNGWTFDPLLKAATNGHVKIVHILLKEFYHNVSTWVDKDGKTLRQHVFTDHLPFQFQFVHIFAQLGIIDGSTYLAPNTKNEKFPLITLLFEHAPVQYLKLLAPTTDFRHLNNFKIFTTTDGTQDVIHGLSLFLLDYDDQLIKDWKTYGADFSQSINSLISQFTNRAVTEMKLFADEQMLDKIFRDYKIWDTLLCKIKQFLMVGVGYNRQDFKYALSTKQLIEQIYYIHLLLVKLCEGNDFPSKFETMLKLIIICMKKHRLFGPSTILTTLFHHVTLNSSEFVRNHRMVFGSYSSFMLCSFLETKRHVTSDRIIQIFTNTVEKYKEALKQGKFPHEIYSDQDINDYDKNDLVHWIHKVIEFKTKQNYTFDVALLRVSQEMKRSCERLHKMLEMSGAKEARDIKIFDTDQILNILDLQEVEINDEMQRIMTKIIDCNGISLIVTFLFHHCFDQKKSDTSKKPNDGLEGIFKVGSKRFVKDTITFTEQAPKIYNLWMSLDRQYHQLLQAFETNDCHDAARDVLIQIDPDYRQAVINGQDPDYGSPLHFATASGDLELVRTLLEFGADPNSRLDETGPLPRLRIESDELEHFKHFRPLHFAAMRGHGEIGKVLLENGSELNVVSDSGWMPVGLAKKYGHEKIVKRLGEKTGGKVSTPP
ncbi:uncharacterized protein LOC120425509 isoform X1 [Culex pipiens pallens]|uniref:uncharacterized protein LOC120425509 isoform X1 n=1 Tax=Culex pipiens pallens TaxID=42434 RepID=UPI0022AB4202|nr:uncharacterized protein LOC120425509 isoform X1 [Culex pipiens pallens]